MYWWYAMYFRSVHAFCIRFWTIEEKFAIPLKPSIGSSSYYDLVNFLFSLHFKNHSPQSWLEWLENKWCWRNYVWVLRQMFLIINEQWLTFHLFSNFYYIWKLLIEYFIIEFIEHLLQFRTIGLQLIRFRIEHFDVS